MAIKISIVIPTKGRVPYLRRLLASCLSQELEKSEYEIFVVSNPHHVETESLMIDSFGHQGNVHYIALANIGTNVARNVGIKASKGEFVLLLDDDCELPTKTYLSDLLQVYRLDEDISGCGGGYLTPSNSNVRTLLNNNLVNLWLLLCRTQEGHSSVLIGGAASYRSKVFKDDHWFNEKIKYGGAETDFNLRLCYHGHKLLFVQKLSVFHHSANSLKTMFFRSIKQGYSAHAFQKEWLGDHGRGDKRDLFRTVTSMKDILKFIFKTKKPLLFFLYLILHVVLLKVGQVGFIIEKYVSRFQRSRF